MQFIKTFITEIKILLYLNKIMIKQKLSLVSDFWTAVIGKIIEQSIAIAFLGIIFSKVNVIKGWNLYEMIFLLGLFVLSRPLYHFFLQGISTISDMVLNGELDSIIIRPINPITLITTKTTEITALADFIVGIIILLYSTSMITIEWTFYKILFVIMVVLSSSLIYAGAHLLKGTGCIFFIKLDAMNALLQQFREYAKYPISIYHPLIKIVLVTMLPYCFASSIPAASFFGKDNISWYGWLCPLFCISYFIITGLIFLWSLRFYKSTGS